MKVQFEVPASNVDREKWQQIDKAQRELDALKSSLLQTFRNSDRFVAALDLAGTKGRTYGKHEVSVVLDGSTLRVSVPIDLIDENDKPKPTLPSVLVDATTVNVLLTGKLLSDDEKRRLLKLYTRGALEFEEVVDAKA